MGQRPSDSRSATVPGASWGEFSVTGGNERRSAEMVASVIRTWSLTQQRLERLRGARGRGGGERHGAWRILPCGVARPH